MISSRKIEDLLPAVQDLAHQFVATCAEVGIDVLIYSTYRDLEAQAALYAQGRTAPGTIITDAAPGFSFHQFRVAWDCVPMLHGKPQWKDTATYARMGELGERLGLTWAGRWTGPLRETAHFQYSKGLKIEDFRAGRLPC